MKQPKKLTRNQKQILSKNRLDATKWSLIEQTDEKIVLINKISGRKRTIVL